MSKTTKIWLITASLLVLVGCIIFVGVMTVFKWDFTKLSTVKYENNEYDISEEYNNISIVTKTADILFLPSDNSKASVSCYDEKNLKHLVTVKDGILVIEAVDNRKWYEHIGINFNTPKVTVYIPEGEYGTLSVKVSTGDVEIPKDFKFESIDILASTGDVKSYSSVSNAVKVKTSTGDICIENANVGALDLSVSTGDIIAKSVTCEGDIKIKVSTGDTKLTDITCKNIISSGSTGGISLKNVIAAEKFSIVRSTGEVKLDSSDAAEIFVKTSTGDVKGSLLTDKVFITKTDTGSIDVPKTTSGGKSEITTSTGDIKIYVSP